MSAAVPGEGFRFALGKQHVTQKRCLKQQPTRNVGMMGLFLPSSMVMPQASPMLPTPLMSEHPVAPSSPLSEYRDTDIPTSPASIHDLSDAFSSPRPELEQTPGSIRKPRTQPRQKLDAVLALLTSLNWGLGDLLSELRQACQSADNRPYHATWASFKRFAYVKVPGSERAKDVLGVKEMEGVRPWCLDIVGNELRGEVVTLGEHPSFGKFEASDKDIKTRVASIISDYTMAIFEAAPTWLHILHVCQHDRVAQQVIVTTDEQRMQIARESLLVFSRLCSMMHARMSDAIPTLLGLYLYEGGARTRVIDTLARFGLCLTSKSVLKRVHSLVETAENDVRELGSNATSVVTWDNFEYREGRRGERAGDQAEFRSITTAMLTSSRMLDAAPAASSYWQPQKFPLSSLRILQSIKGTRLPVPLRLFFIESSFRDLVTIQHPPWAISPPEIQRLPKCKTTFLPMQPILVNESTTENNIHIIDNIFSSQLRLDLENEEQWKNTIRMASGDLKTWSRIQSAKQIRADTASRHYDSLRWVLPVLGLWHLKYNMLQLIHRIHWGGPHEDMSTLQFAADSWQRTNVVDGKKFAPMEELILQSYKSRVVSLLVDQLKRESVKYDTLEDLAAWLGNQSTDSWASTLNSIERQLQVSSTESGSSTGSPVDQVRNNHQRFCAHVEVYMLLRYAIRIADIGLLRVALRHATIMFLPSESSTPRYAAALLYTLHLTDSPASDQKLQDHVLANSLVNLRGLEDTNFEHDRLLELHNNALKVYQRERTTFTTHNDELLQKWATLMPMMSQMKLVVERAAGLSFDSRHPSKNCVEDIWRMAHQLAGRRRYNARTDRFSHYPVPDLFSLGIAKLPEATVSYNEALHRHGSITEVINLEGSHVEEEAKEVPDHPLALAEFDAGLLNAENAWLNVADNEELPSFN